MKIDDAQWKDSQRVWFEEDDKSDKNEDVNSEASFGRSENDISALGPAFDKIHLQNYSESATKVWPKTFDHKFQ